uniref:P17/29C-like protein DDB_G0287399 n=1 Tax=Petromyzon marinus TaxID=7757 RepID=A0AAJ7SKY6_PETMA|nr:P17/29C-like protein DDB_G0287399 [Petromyzon marinus]XP_032801371.1 P17/29C-like protein DDB_G0287399 [Petromyzon marinus]
MVAGGGGGGAVRASALARSGTEVLRGPGTEELPSNNSSSSNNNSNSSSGNSSSGKFTPLLADLGCSQEEIPSKRSRRSGPHEGTASD